MDLTEFLRARLDEDEEVAKAGSDPGGPHWPNSDSETRTPQMEHARRHDPARVLAEVDAKRRIVTEHGPNEHGLCDVCVMNDDAHRAPCPTLRLLALPYTDHPDYDQTWRP